MFTFNTDKWHFSTKYIYNQFQTLKHKWMVFLHIHRLCVQLYKRAIVHDLSKMREPEASAFAGAVLDLRKIEFGTPDYKKSAETIGPCLKHHYACNSHHYQHYQNKFKGMNALDRLEMCADWAASAMRTKNGDVFKSLEINQPKAGYTNADKEWIKQVILTMKGNDDGTGN